MLLSSLSHVNDHLQSARIRHHGILKSVLGIVYVRMEILVSLCRGDSVVHDNRCADAEIGLEQLKRGEGEIGPYYLAGSAHCRFSGASPSKGGK